MSFITIVTTFWVKNVREIKVPTPAQKKLFEQAGKYSKTHNGPPI